MNWARCPWRLLIHTRVPTHSPSASSNCQFKRRYVCQSSTSYFAVSQELDKRRLKQRLGAEHLDLEDGEGVCAAYCLNYPVQLSQVANAFEDASFMATKKHRLNTFKIKNLHLLASDVLHLPVHTSKSKTVDHGHVFFFRSGAAVFWGLPIDLRRQLFRELSKHQEYEPPYPSTDITTDTRERSFPLRMEDFDHEFGYNVDPKLSQSSFHNDRIYLQSFSDPETLLALSYGLAQSVKLLIYEEQIDALVQRTRKLPGELARHGKIKLSHKELKGLIGELLAARYSVNLVSDILDTPEYFWQNPELENLHMECARGIELRQRARILDTRTQVIKDALDLLNNELSSSSSDRVERAILFLIAVEVVLELARLIPLAFRH